MIVRKSKKNNKEFNEEISYARQMLEFFNECYRVLKNDGVLIVWFTHRQMKAWRSIISAIYGSGFVITRIWPVTTELLTRLVAKENEVLDKTLIIVARKKNSNSEIDMEAHALNLARGVIEALYEVGTNKNELKTFLYAAVISSITVLPKDEKTDPIEYCYSKLIPKAVKIADELFSKIEEDFDRKYSELNYFDFDEFSAI